MAIAKAKTSDDIIVGASAVAVGAAKPLIHDDPQYTTHIPSGDNLGYITNINSRYRYHGGVGGSGNWEH